MKTKRKTKKMTAEAETKPEPARLHGGGITAAKLRCELQADPVDKSEALTRDNTRDVIIADYEDAARQWVEPLRKDARKLWDGRKQWAEAGGPCPADLLTSAIVSVQCYPGHMGGLGMDYAPAREAQSVRQCLAALDSVMRCARVILSAAASDSDMDPAAIESGIVALRKAYEPQPNMNGTTSGIAYPRDVNAGPWPECMDWRQVPAHMEADLRRLADSLVRLNHSTGKTAAKWTEAQRVEREKAKRQRDGRRYGKQGGASKADGDDAVKEAVKAVRARKDYNKTLSWLRCCELIIAERGLSIKPPALAKHERMTRKRKKQK